MANKRMFSNDIVGSDAFLEMPATSQSLYFHLGMRCDDDGFVNPNVTMRMIGANKNDLDILIAKRFLLAFKNGVLVIKHHRINNKWDSRDCRRTLYTEELKTLFIKENNSYTLDSEQGIPVAEKYFINKDNMLSDGNPTGTRRQNRIDKNRIDKNIYMPTSVGATKKKTMKEYKEPSLDIITGDIDDGKEKKIVDIELKEFYKWYLDYVLKVEKKIPEIGWVAKRRVEKVKKEHGIKAIREIVQDAVDGGFALKVSYDLAKILNANAINKYEMQ